jgi:hypothetical protein
MLVPRRRAEGIEMASLHVCDHRDCPAVALHHVDLCEQDFHFCNHHWAKLESAVTAFLDPWGPVTPIEGPLRPGPAFPLVPEPVRMHAAR